MEAAGRNSEPLSHHNRSNRGVVIKYRPVLCLPLAMESMREFTLGNLLNEAWLGATSALISGLSVSMTMCDTVLNSVSLRSRVKDLDGGIVEECAWNDPAAFSIRQILQTFSYLPL
jgi:hypothetical protein